MAIQLVRHAEVEVYATASAVNHDFVVDTIGGDVFARSLAVLALGFGQIISVLDPTRLGEV